MRIEDSKGAGVGKYELVFNFQHSQTLFFHLHGFLLLFDDSCIYVQTQWRTYMPLDWWIPIAPSGSRQLGRPRCNLAAGRDHWGGSDAGRQATSRVIWGSKTGCGAHSLSTRRTHALSINCGVDHLSQCVCELQYLCTCTEKIRNHRPEGAFEVCVPPVVRDGNS